jgi:hypothetical protein
MVTTRTKLPSKRIVADFGNGYTKVIDTKGNLHVIPSMVAFITDRDKYPHCDIFDFVKSKALDTVPTATWICGNDAREYAPNSLIRVGEFARSEGKQMLALNLLAPFFDTKDCDYEIVASVPDVTIQGQALKDALIGTHTIKAGGKQFTARITSVTVQSEGFGAAYYAISKGHAPLGKRTATFDIGDGTFILSVFNDKGKEIDEMRRVLPEGGCNSLYNAIAEHGDIKRMFNGAIKAEFVEQALREHLANPGSAFLIDSFDATNLYSEVKKVWFTRLFNTMKSTLSPIKTQIGAVVAFGGGVGLVKHELGNVPKMLIEPDYQTVSVSGLSLYASKK